MAIISISGKLNSGKDTVGEIIQILTSSPHFTNEGVLSFLGRKHFTPAWEIKKWADKLKDIVCLLLGCTREQLEDREFKEKELGPEWWSIKKWYPNNNPEKEFTLMPYEGFDERIFDGDDCMWEVIKMTPRLMLQLIGTQAGRQIIHPQIWVNSLMSDYKPTDRREPREGYVYHGDGLKHVNSGELVNFNDKNSTEVYPDWVITDTRFPNEADAVSLKGGINIRVNRPWYYTLLEDGRHEFSQKEDKTGVVYKIASKYSKEEAELIYKEDFNSKQHESETALDNYEKFDYIIENDGTLLELIQKVREILISEELM